MHLIVNENFYYFLFYLRTIFNVILFILKTITLTNKEFSYITK